MVALLAVTLTGCWDQRPVNNRDIVTTIGIDPGPQPGEYRWTFVFPNPTTEPVGLGGSPGGPEVFSTTVVARTFAGAVSDAQSSNTRQIYLGQIRMVAFSTKLPATAWYHVMNALNRTGAVVETLWIVGSKDAGATALYVPPSEQVPEVGTYQALSCGCLAVRWGSRLWQSWSESQTPGMSPTFPLVSVHGQTFRFRQVAILSPKSVTVWSEPQSDGWAYLTNRVLRAAVTVRTANGELWAVSGVTGHTSVSFRNGPDGVTVLATVRESGYLSDTPGGTTVAPTEEWHLEQAVSRHILTRCMAAIAEARRTDTDPFGWHRNYRWSGLSAGHEAWTRSWSHWHVRVLVEFNLQGRGLMR